MSIQFYVVSDARKLVFRPSKGANEVCFPYEVIVNDYGVNNFDPTVVVRNGTENPPTWQGASYDTGCIIINEVPGEIAQNALHMYVGARSDNAALYAVLYYLQSEGYVDQYTASLDFVENHLSPAGLVLSACKYTGIFKRDDRDLSTIWLENGKIVILQPGHEETRDITPEILLRTYLMPDGSPINLDDIPEGRPEGI